MAGSSDHDDPGVTLPLALAEEAALDSPAAEYSALGSQVASSLKERFRQTYRPGDYVVIAVGNAALTADHVAAASMIEAARLFRERFPGVVGYVHRVGDDH